MPVAKVALHSQMVSNGIQCTKHSTGGRQMHAFTPPLKAGRGLIIKLYAKCNSLKSFFTLDYFNFCQKLQQVSTIYLLSTGAAVPRSTSSLWRRE